MGNRTSDEPEFSGGGIFSSSTPTKSSFLDDVNLIEEALTNHSGQERKVERKLKRKPRLDPVIANLHDGASYVLAF